MTEPDDRFDALLRQSLAPPEREEDHVFAAKVAARAVLEGHLAAERRSAARRAVRDLVAVAALGAAIWAVTEAPSVTSFVGANQAVALATMILSFVAWIGLLARLDSTRRFSLRLRRE